MARGAAGAAQSNLGTTNAIGAQNNTEAQNLEGQLVPTYTSMLNMGETPQQSEAATNNGEGAVASSYGAAQMGANNAAARTNNGSSLAAQQDALAMQKGQATAGEANNLQTQNNAVLQANREAGLSGLQSTFGSNQGQTASMYGLGPNTIQAWNGANAQNTALLGDVLGAGGAIGAAYAGKQS